jgi:diguanylate cyclase (GGDEF)-like protein
MIDIDRFKVINDTRGHAAGDRVLKAVAQALVGSAREIDVVGRIGGEEFCVLLPRTDRSAADRAAERLRAAIADLAVPWKEQFIEVTASIGVAVCESASESSQTVLDRADKAMYRAKETGRNRVVVASTASTQRSDQSSEGFPRSR